MNKRGSILLHVMVTAVLIALIAASLLRMTMLRYRMIERSEKILVEKRDDQYILANIVAYWNSANSANGVDGVTCADKVPNYSCTMPFGPSPTISPGACGCTCSPTIDPTMPTVYTQVNAGGDCVLTITSTDRP